MSLGNTSRTGHLVIPEDQTYQGNTNQESTLTQDRWKSKSTKARIAREMENWLIKPPKANPLTNTVKHSPTDTYHPAKKLNLTLQVNRQSFDLAIHS